jgi:maspardin
MEKLLQTVRKRYPTRELAIAGARWPVRDTGSSAKDDVAMLLLPGALGTGDVFYQLLAALGADYRLISVSFPAIGSAQNLADGLAALLDALALPVVDVLGTSLGGYVAQAAALSHPGRFRKLVLANTFYDPSLQQSRWPPAAEYARIPAADVLAAARAQLENGAAPTPEQADLKRLMLDLVGTDQSAEGVRAMRLSVLTALPLGRVPLADGAITLIDDDKDPVIAAATRQQMRERYQACRHIRIEGGGHFPANLRPADYARAVRSVLESCAPSAGKE